VALRQAYRGRWRDSDRRRKRNRARLLPGVGLHLEPTWHLEISSGLDHLEATVAAPGRTTITAAAQNATVPAGQVEIQWTDAWGEKAQSTWVSPCCDSAARC